jgi:hypothetical protein
MTICGACGKVWTGEPCGQAENGWPFQTCYPIEPWRPIETAPKMKNIILWAATDVSDSGEIKNWKMETGYWNAGAETWVWGGSQVRKYDIQPTHWLPMPPPPAGTDEDGLDPRTPQFGVAGEFRR